MPTTATEPAAMTAARTRRRSGRLDRAASVEPDAGGVKDGERGSVSEVLMTSRFAGRCVLPLCGSCDELMTATAMHTCD